jgi:uncharacterized protein
MDTQDLLGQEQTPLNAPTPDEKTMGILSHILCLVGGFIAPLVIYLVKKDESAYVREQAKESLNFQITVLICAGRNIIGFSCSNSRPGADYYRYD